MIILIFTEREIKNYGTKIRIGKVYYNATINGFFNLYCRAKEFGFHLPAEKSARFCLNADSIRRITTEQFNVPNRNLITKTVSCYYKVNANEIFQ